MAVAVAMYFICCFLLDALSHVCSDSAASRMDPKELRTKSRTRSRQTTCHAKIDSSSGAASFGYISDHLEMSIGRLLFGTWQKRAIVVIINVLRNVIPMAATPQPVQSMYSITIAFPSFYRLHCAALA